MGLCQAHLNRATTVLDGGHWRCSSAAVVAADLDDVSIGLGHAAGHCADARLGDQLHADLG